MLHKRTRAPWIINLINNFGGTQKVAYIVDCKRDYLYQWYDEVPPRCAWKLLAFSLKHKLEIGPEDIRPGNFIKPKAVSLSTVSPTE